MKSFILEDDIEQALLKKLKEVPFNYDVILCNPSLESQDNPDNGPHRDSVDQCVLPTILYDSLIKLNPNISKEKIQETVKNLSKNFTDKDIVETNYKLYQMIREKIKITEKRNGKEEFDFINLIDFENPENNNFTAVSQMWIKGTFGYRRPDVLIFVNGLPLVFIELKNETVKIQEAFTKNLTDYKKTIPNILFVYWLQEKVILVKITATSDKNAYIKMHT